MPVTYKKIATVTVTTATQAAIEFTSISGTFTDLVVKISARGDQTIGNAGLNIQFNGLTTNLSWRRLIGNGASASSANDTGGARIAELQGSDATADTFSNYEVYIPNYFGSTNKSFSSDSVNETNATTEYMGLYAGLWADTSAITSIKLVPSTGTLVQHSTATLYGIKKD